MYIFTPDLRFILNHPVY